MKIQLGLALLVGLSAVQVSAKSLTVTKDFVGTGTVTITPGSYTVDTFDIRVPSGQEAEIRVRITNSEFYGGACSLCYVFSGGHAATPHKFSSSPPYECTVRSNTVLNLIPWIERLNDSYETRRVDLPYGPTIYLPVGGFVSSYRGTFGYEVKVSYIRRFRVSFSGGGGTVSAASREYIDGRPYEFFPAVERKGYVFLGWYTAKTGGTNVFVPGSKASRKVTKLYARWRACKFKVHFNANGGGGKMSNQSFTYGKYANLRANAFTRKGHAFAGWAKTSSGKVAYANKKKVRNLSSTDGSVVELFAKWKLKSYKLSIKVSGKGTVSGAGNHAYGKQVSLVAKPKKGYVFVGWYKRDGKTKLSTVSSFRQASNAYKMPAAAMTVVAKFATLAKSKAALKLSCSPAKAGYQIRSAMSLKVVGSGLTSVSYSASGLPDGLKINTSTGEISGSPLAVGTFPVTVRISDSAGQTKSLKLILDVNLGPLPNWALGTFYGFVDVAGTCHPTTMTVGQNGKVSGKLEDGYTWNSFMADAYAETDREGKCYRLPVQVTAGGRSLSLVLEVQDGEVAVMGDARGSLGRQYGGKDLFVNVTYGGSNLLLGMNAGDRLSIVEVQGGMLSGSYLSANSPPLPFLNVPVFEIRRFDASRGKTVTELHAISLFAVLRFRSFV